MTDETKDGRQGEGQQVAKLDPERERFQRLLLANPNHFGNLEVQPSAAALKLLQNTAYEELLCLGLNPDHDRLEAILAVKREAGYGGDICTAGSREYVRFYVDLHGDGAWHDVGLGEVRVHDIPGKKPLCYAVARRFTPVLKLCLRENLIKVLAILSWTVPPPPNQPGFSPVYGNRLTATVQIRPQRLLLWRELTRELELAKLKLPDPIGPIAHLVEPSTPLPMALPASTTLAERRERYRAEAVPVHRFAFAEVQRLLAKPLAPTISLGASPFVALGLEATEVADILGKIGLTSSGDTTYEELRCCGLRPEGDLLAATFTLKRRSGYSGGLCTAGSYEYVAFWIDFGDGAGFSHLGTAAVRVHDLTTIPAEGLQYAVYWKTDLGKRIVPCTAGPRVVRLRAILSWEVPPPAGNPSFVPVWGNRKDCLVQLRPGELAGHVPVIETVGNVGVNDIDQSTGLATGAGVGATFSADQSPFGGAVHVTGRIGDPPDTFGGAEAKFRYRIEVSPAAGPEDWHALTNPITVKVSEFLNGVPIPCAPGGDTVCDVTLTPSDDHDGLGDGWYDYLQDYKGPYTRFLVEDQLASWWTNPGMEGRWKIRITAKDMATTPPTVYPGFQPAAGPIQVEIDNTPPTCDLAITSATLDGDPLPAADCGKFPVGTILTGTYEVHDLGTSFPEQHFGGWSLYVLPSDVAHGAMPVPAARAFPVVPTTGEAGTWTLDTHGMDPCGYVVRIDACDRTVYNSGFVGLCTPKEVGFCLEAPAKS